MSLISFGAFVGWRILDAILLICTFASLARFADRPTLHSNAPGVLMARRIEIVGDFVVVCSALVYFTKLQIARPTVTLTLGKPEASQVGISISPYLVGHRTVLVNTSVFKRVRGWVFALDVGRDLFAAGTEYANQSGAMVIAVVVAGTAFLWKIVMRQPRPALFVSLSWLLVLQAWSYVVNTRTFSHQLDSVSNSLWGSIVVMKLYFGLFFFLHVYLFLTSSPSALPTSKATSNGPEEVPTVKTTALK
ncbi:hypothetical protein BDK51DRAFT_30572, partial [Blyttiomyces helicus]